MTFADMKPELVALEAKIPERESLYIERLVSLEKLPGHRHQNESGFLSLHLGYGYFSGSWLQLRTMGNPSEVLGGRQFPTEEGIDRFLAGSFNDLYAPSNPHCKPPGEKK